MAFEYPPCTYRVSVKAVIVVEDKLILVKEESKEWDLPGGGLEHHEELIDGLHREIEEEIGSKLNSVDSDRTSVWATYDETANRPLLFLVYPATLGGSLQPSFKRDVEVGLFGSDELDRVPLVAHIEKFRRQLIRIAFENRNNI